MYCGSAGCTTEVISIENNKVKTLFSDNAYEILPYFGSTNGYKDISAAMHGSDIGVNTELLYSNLMVKNTNIINIAKCSIRVFWFIVVKCVKTSSSF
jgi:hypothetical protein